MRKLVHLFLLVCMFGALAGFSIGAGTANADAGHVLAVTDVSVVEGDAGVLGLATVTVSVSPAPVAGEQVRVDYGTSAIAAQGATARSTAAGDPTPTFPEDFAQTDGTLTFEALETAKTFPVSILGDNADEADEIFFVNIYNARGECVVPGTCTTSALIGDPKAAVTITDDDPTPTLAIDDVSHDEGDAGDTLYTFTVTKTGASAKDVTVAYATADDSAAQPGDYTSASGTLTFSASNANAPVTEEIEVTAKGDTSFEDDEVFKMNLSNAANGSITDGEGLGTVVNDDAVPPPTMSAGDATGSEGEDVNLTATLQTPPGPGQTATVDYAVVQGSGPGTATAAIDYVAATGSLVFTAGEAEQIVSVLTIEDALHEANETFSLVLTRPVAHGTGGFTYTLDDDTAVGTIQDDEAAPTLSIDDVSVSPEGDTGLQTATFTVTKDGSTDQTSTVHVLTADDTALAGSDYTALADTELTFAPEETSKQITVDVLGDVLDEADETYAVVLGSPTNATIADGTGSGSIVDDDEAVTAFSIDDVTVTEGNSGTSAATFTVTRTGPSGQLTTVGYASSDGSATEGEDYNLAAGLLSFTASETSKTVTVDVIGDTTDEPNDTFDVTLSNPVNASIVEGEGTGTGTITDDDAAPTLSVSDVVVTEKDTETVDATFTVTKSGSTINSASVNYATSDVGAKSGTDYVAKTGNLTFTPAETSKTVTVTVNGDTLDEAYEYFLLNVSNASNSTIADGAGGGGIVDNDAAPSISIGNDSVEENASKACTLLVKLSAKSGREVTVSYTTVSGSAGTADYVAKTGTVKFVAGDAAEQIKIFARADSKDEPTEKFTVKLSGISPSGAATFANTTGTCSLIDND